jgi:hypothetical protein
MKRMAPGQYAGVCSTRWVSGSACQSDLIEASRSVQLDHRLDRRFWVYLAPDAQIINQFRV